MCANAKRLVEPAKNDVLDELFAAPREPWNGQARRTFTE